MGVDIQLPHRHHASPQQHPYSSAISSSASSSSSSVFSVDATSSQTSDVSYTSASVSVSWDAEDSWRVSTAKSVLPPVQVQTVQPCVPVELRQHPRRHASTVAQRPPPTLVRQSERKGQFVDSLVDSATQMVEVIWPLSVPNCGSAERYYNQGVLPLRTFIQETLRRSRTSFSTLQVALYYLILIKAHVPKHDFTMEQPVDSTWCRTLQCGRRMFLAALILASKYLQDRNYSARAWSKISGLKVSEINTNEMAFLEAVNWKLHFPEPLFDRWQAILLKYTAQGPASPISPAFRQQSSWKTIVPRLTPELDTVDLTPQIAQSPYIKPAASYPTPIMVSTGMMQAPMTPVSPMLPRTLEPAPYPQPPTPSFVRMGPLPTPSLTPQSVISNTPAARYTGYETAKAPSYGSAMAQAQNAIRRETFNNCSIDFWTQAASARRPSVVSSASSASSPESMVSDSSSRCSRASSISSTSSIIISSTSASAPTPTNKLCRMATLRSAGLKVNTTQQYPSHVGRYSGKDNGVNLGSITMEPLTAEPMSSPDLESFHIADAEIESPTSRHHNYSVKETNAQAIKRKRGRSSIDLTLQQNVRNLLQASTLLADSGCIEVLPDRTVASSFLLNAPSSSTSSILSHKALQSPARSVPERRLPVQKDLGRKRACCAPLTVVQTNSPQLVSWY